MCTTGYLSSLLFSNCKRADGQKIAEGSKGRLFRMRKGLHPDSGAATWPDGRASSIRINMRKYHFPQAAVMPRKCIVPQQKVFLPLSAKTPVCVPDALQLHVNGVCNTFINDFQTAIEADYDCKVIFRSLGQVNASPPQIAKSVATWLGSSDWEATLDVLLERSWEVEVALSELIDVLKGDQSVARRALHKLALNG